MEDNGFENIIERIKKLKQMAEPAGEILFSEIDSIIKDSVSDYEILERKFDQLINMGFIINIDPSFSKFYNYVYNIYPELADDYLDIYNDFFNDDDKIDEDKLH